MRHITIVVINGTAAKLQQLAGKHTRCVGRDNLLVYLKQQITLKLVIGFKGFIIKHNRDLVVNARRQLQVVLGCHADANITYGFKHGSLGPVFCLVLCKMPAVCIAIKIHLPVLRNGLAQPCALIQQINLCPKVLNTFGGWCAGKQHNLTHKAAYQL